MDRLQRMADLQRAIDLYDAQRRDAIDCLKALIADMMEHGMTLAEIDAYLSSDPFTMVGVTLPPDLVRAALALA